MSDNAKIVREENITFRILSALGILFVVMGHEGCYQLEFEMWLPYYSFHMALFAFISGYFYTANNDMHLWHFLLKKTRTLLLPYYIVSLFYLLLQTWLSNYGISFGLKFSFNNWIVRPWFRCQPLGFNIATWFVIAIFITEVMYILARVAARLITDESSRDILLLFLLAIGAACVINWSPYPTEWQRVWLRPVFLCFFCHFGYCFKRYIEGKVKIPYISVIIIAFISRAILIKYFGKCDYGLWDCDFGGTPWWAIFITTLTGIGFWLAVAKAIALNVHKDSFLLKIGRHTREIMSHHLFAAFLWHGAIYLFHQLFSLGEVFNIDDWKTKLYFRYSPWGGVWLNYSYC